MIELTPRTLEPNVLNDLLLPRQRYLDAVNQFAPVVFTAEPLQGFPYSSEMDKALLPLQARVTGLNKAYVEKARLAAANAVNTLHWRYYGNLVGRLRHVDAKIDPPSNRLYYYVPPDIQYSVTEAELQALKALALREDSGFWDAITLFCQVIHKRDSTGLTPNQVGIIREIYRQVHERHHCPGFGQEGPFICQIHLDNRLIRKIKDGAPLVKLQEGIDCLVKKTK